MSDADVLAMERPNGADPTGAAEPSAGGSLLAGLRAKRDEIRRETTRDFPIPGFGGELVCRYEVMPWEKAREINRRMEKAGDHPRREINLFADELIAACQELFVRQDGELVSIDSPPVRYGDKRLAEGLEFESGTAREQIHRLFVLGVGEARADYVLNDHHTEVMVWMRGLDDDVEDGGAEQEVERDFAGK